MFGTEVERTKRKSVEWYTPKWIFDELGIQFDLDPASPHDFDSFVPAAQKYTVYDNGLTLPWHGRVWLNPPYGPDTAFWMRRMIDHGNGIALVFSRTDAEWCQKAMQAADAILFMSGRIAFVPGRENAHKVSRSGAGTMLIAFGSECRDALWKMRERGTLILNNGIWGAA